jgi:hypothetical protein
VAKAPGSVAAAIAFLENIFFARRIASMSEKAQRGLAKEEKAVLHSATKENCEVRVVM